MNRRGGYNRDRRSAERDGDGKLFFIFCVLPFHRKTSNYSIKKMMTIHCAKSELDQKREKMIKP